MKNLFHSIILLISISFISVEFSYGQCAMTIINAGDCDYNGDIIYRDVFGVNQAYPVYIPFNSNAVYYPTPNCDVIVGVIIYGIGALNNANVSAANTNDDVACPDGPGSLNNVVWNNPSSVDIVP